VPLVVGEICFVSGDFHRLKSASANQSPKKSQSNQVICAFLFFKQALRNLSVVGAFSIAGRVSRRSASSMMANIDLRAAAAGALGKRMNSSRGVMAVGWLSFFINKNVSTNGGSY
jgi:hypothetical protein